ncbi:hypothetical protein [Streptomyces europaeiscabiei]|uniref:hypothetical protein n=1 Tax=Streptomyces europaeiscabiei TaxID=146819 RepID=UPI0038D515A9
MSSQEAAIAGTWSTPSDMDGSNSSARDRAVSAPPPRSSGSGGGAETVRLVELLSRRGLEDDPRPQAALKSVASVVGSPVAGS